MTSTRNRSRHRSLTDAPEVRQAGLWEQADQYASFGLFDLTEAANALASLAQELEDGHMTLLALWARDLALDALNLRACVDSALQFHAPNPGEERSAAS